MLNVFPYIPNNIHKFRRKLELFDVILLEVMSGAVTHLFAIPEALLQPKWRNVLLKMYGKKIVSQTYDEAHTVSEW